MKHIVAAKLLVIDDEGDVLVLRNSGTHPRWTLKNDLPGGTVEEEETVEEAVVRETEEETSLVVDVSEVKLLYASTDVTKDAVIVRHLFKTHISKKPDVKLSWEHDEYWWIPLQEATGIEPAYQRAIDVLKQNDLLG